MTRVFVVKAGIPRAALFHCFVERHAPARRGLTGLSACRSGQRHALSGPERSLHAAFAARRAENVMICATCRISSGNVLDHRLPPITGPMSDWSSNPASRLRLGSP